MQKEDILYSGICYPLGRNEDEEIQKYIFYLGFTFSFPCKQESLASARLSEWTKGFNGSGVVNEDVVQLLQEAINEKVIQTK